jgi:hypothetical protein
MWVAMPSDRGLLALRVEELADLVRHIDELVRRDLLPGGDMESAQLE